MPGLSLFTDTSFSGAIKPETASAFALSSMGAIGQLHSMAKGGHLQVIPCHVIPAR